MSCPRWLPCSAFLLLAIVLGLFLLFLNFTEQYPKIHSVTYSYPGEEEKQSDLPLKIRSAGAKIDLTAQVNIAAPIAQTYIVTPDDCLQELWINDVLIDDPAIPFCLPKEKALQIGSYMRTGKNTIRAIMTDIGVVMVFKIRHPETDAMLLGSGSYRVDEGKPVPFIFPLNDRSPEHADELTVRFTLDVPYFFPHQYRISVDDCVEALHINGREVQHEQIPFCGVQSIALGSYIHAGSNEVQIMVRDKGKHARLTFDLDRKNDPILFFVKLFLAFIILVVGLVFF